LIHWGWRFTFNFQPHSKTEHTNYIMPQPNIQSSLSRGSGRQRKRQQWHVSTIRCLILAVALFVLVLWILAIFGMLSSNDDNNTNNNIDAVNIKPATNIQQIIADNNNAASNHINDDSTIPKSRATIAYAVSLTSCGITTDRHDNIKNGGHSSDASFSEGAAVLQHSIHLSSIRNYHQSKSLFDYEVSY